MKQSKLHTAIVFSIFLAASPCCAQKSSIIDEVNSLVHSSLETGSLFQQHPQFLPFTFLNRLDRERVTFHINKAQTHTWDMLSTSQKKIYGVNVTWKSIDGAGSGKIIVCVLVSGLTKQSVFYFAQEENVVNRRLSSLALSWKNNLALLQQIRNESTFQIYERLKIFVPSEDSYRILTDLSLLDSLASDYPSPWGPIVYRNKQYQHLRLKIIDIVSEFYPGIGVADDQFLPAWQSGDIDGDGRDDLVTIVQMEGYSPSMLVLLTSHPREPYTLGKLGQDFAILPSKKAIHLIWHEAASGMYLWDGTDFLWKQLGD